MLFDHHAETITIIQTDWILETIVTRLIEGDTKMARMIDIFIPLHFDGVTGSKNGDVVPSRAALYSTRPLLQHVGTMTRFRKIQRQMCVGCTGTK